MPEEQQPGGRPTTTVTRENETNERARASARIQTAAFEIASAVTYGLVHSLEDAIRRNRTHGWADGDLRNFRLRNDEEVRRAWALFERRRRDR
jgi:hypothetical protein